MADCPRELAGRRPFIYNGNMISIIVAMAKNRVIGKSNDLPWYLPADLKHFKEVTTGHSVVMGRKTFDSIVQRLGKPLPNRQNIVITRDENYQSPGVYVAHTIEEALQKAKDKNVFVIGGEQIFALALPLADRLIITEVNADIDGDTYFPEFNTAEFSEVAREDHQKDAKNSYDYSFVTLQRK